MITRRWDRVKRLLSIPSALEGGLHYEDALLARAGHVVYYGRALDRIIKITDPSGKNGGPYFWLERFGLVCYTVVRFPAEVGC